MDSKQASQVTTGLVIVAVGVILLAGQLDMSWGFDFGRLWPVVFVVLAVGRLLAGDWRGVVTFGFMSVIFFMHTYRIVTLRDSWPLFIVMAGVTMLFPKGEGRVKS